MHERGDVWCSSLRESPYSGVAIFTRARDYFPRSTIPEKKCETTHSLEIGIIYMANRLACPWELYFYLARILVMMPAIVLRD